MAGPFIEALKGVHDYKTADDHFDKEWNQFSEAIWNLSQNLFNGKTDEEKAAFELAFTNCNSTGNRIKMMFEQENMMKEFRQIADHLLLDKLTDAQKDPLAASEAATEGEELFLDNKKSEALIYFNKAILLCDHDTQSSLLSLSLMRRGQILQESLYLGFALHDFLDAKMYCEESTKEIDSLKAKCVKQILKNEFMATQTQFEKSADLQFEDEEAKEFELARKASRQLYAPTFHKNKELPGGSESVYMDYLPDKGRVIRAKCDLPKGKVVFSEKAFLSWLRPASYEKYCSHCLLQLQVRFFPCRSCIDVKYCSSQCERTAWSQYHCEECSYLKTLQYLSYGHMSLRILISAGIDYAIQVNENDAVKPCEWPSQTFKHDYHSFSSLVSEQIGQDYVHLIAFSSGICILLLIMEDMGLISREKDEEKFFKVSSLLLKHIYQINLNCYLLRDHLFQDLDLFGIVSHTPETIKLGIAVYLSSSLLSHDCDFNTFKYSVGSQSVLLTERPIEAGQEVTVSYCPYYVRMSVYDRKKFLREGYYFECECNACQYGWENVGYAFKCPACDGPIIWNDDNTNYCIQCSVENIEIKPFWDTVEEAERLLAKGKKLLNDGKLKEAKKKLKESQKKFKSTYFSTCRQSAVKYELARYYELVNDYRKASKQWLETIPLEKEICGEETLEVANILLKTAQVLRVQHKNRLCKRMQIGILAKKSKIQKLETEAVKILESYQGADVKMVYNNYTDYLFRLRPLVEGKRLK